jgi:GMP synthase (glutamine-hydrolysing)
MGLQRFRLLQARDQGDPVIVEERAAFASRLGVSVEQLVVHDCINQATSADIVTAGVDAVLVGGSGEYSVYDDEPWLQQFKDTLGELAERQFPTFASCFGFQALVEALGGEVGLDSDGAEVGTYALRLTDAAKSDPLFGKLPDNFLAQEGHKDRAFRLPEQVVNLASSERCPYQAIRIGPGPVYATQFHPELTGTGNRARFQRYLTVYAKVFGDERATEMLKGFQASPATEDLLARFAAMLND